MERLEEEDIPVDDFTIEDKKKRVRLKDDLYQMIVAFQAGQKSPNERGSSSPPEGIRRITDAFCFPAPALYWRLSGYYFSTLPSSGRFRPFRLYLQSLCVVSAWDIGLLMSQMQLMRLFGPLAAWGTLADRASRRVPIVRLAAIASLIGFSAFFLAHDFGTLLVAMALMSFFWSAALPWSRPSPSIICAREPGAIAASASGARWVSSLR